MHGIGLFAAQFIPQGTVTWEYHSEFDTSYDEADIARMSPPAREQFLQYAYFDNEQGRYVLCFDSQRFINHSSDAPNIISTPRRDVGARDIQEGEELLCDSKVSMSPALLPARAFLSLKEMTVRSTRAAMETKPDNPNIYDQRWNAQTYMQRSGKTFVRGD